MRVDKRPSNGLINPHQPLSTLINPFHMRFAVLDLGTNTFHLLIAEQDATGQWQTLVREKRYVKLAEEGIQRIGDAAFARGLAALQSFKIQLEKYQVPPSAMRAFGTAALRTAENAPAFLEEVVALTGIRPESIPGDREAAHGVGVCDGVGV